MNLSGEQKIGASRQAVWAALNDPDVLRASIPGCLALEKLSDDRMRAVVEVKIGPIGARFNGEVVLSDQVPPESYTISGQGQGGTAGNARGGARVRLSEVSDGTLLSYDVDAQVGGRLAQLGGPIVEATAKQLAGKFFRKFGEVVEQLVAATPRAVTEEKAFVAQGESFAPLAPAPHSAAPAAWLLAVLSATLIGFLLGRAQGGVAAADWIGLSIGLLLVIVAGAAFEFGRRAGAPMLMLDTAMLRRLVQGDGA